MSTGSEFIAFTQWVKKLGFNVDDYPGCIWSGVLHKIEHDHSGKNIIKNTIHDIEEYQTNHPIIIREEEND